MTDRIYVIVYPNSKVPVGYDWGEHLLTAEEVKQRRLTNPTLNVGMMWGPVIRRGETGGGIEKSF